MVAHDIIVIGGSAGGVEAVLELTKDLPGDIPAAILVVVHCSPGSRGLLADLVDRGSAISASLAVDGEAIEHGRIYVARPDHHLLVRPGHVHLSRGPKENSARPAVNPLFRTAALTFGPRVVGVILSGNLDDGTAGLLAIVEAGGVAIVQDPEEARFPGMPASARQYLDGKVRVHPLKEIAPLLDRLARTPITVTDTASTAEASMDREAGRSNWRGEYVRYGEAAGLTCPECAGPLWEIREGGLVQFGCLIGHVYSPETLLSASETHVEETLGMSLRALEERAVLAQRLAEHVREQGGDTRHVDRHLQQAASALEQARRVRLVLQEAPESVPEAAAD